MAGGKLSLGVRLALACYGLAWRVALPALRRNKRLAEGWEQRTLKAGPLPKADLWIQAASGGEAYLAWELLRRLPDVLPQDSQSRRPRILVTTFTAQGLGVLRQAAQLLAERIELLPAWFPFDLPGRMEEALAAVSPRAVVLLETELWPGLLAACRRQGVDALVLNARMTEKSRKGYAHMPGFWKALSPRRVMAVSPDDAGRFAELFPPAAVSVMPNIKFDRLDFSAAPQARDLGQLLPEGKAAPFVVLGSVRKQEEAEALQIVKGLLARVPGVVVGLFPRHMERVPAWAEALSKAGVPFSRRSAEAAATPGSVILWDAFGELGAAFGLARTCFLGGSLAELGGQNFLEPLAHGVIPVIGPSWSNFAWVGAEIFDAGLARREKHWQGVLSSLAELALNPPPRAAVLQEAERYAKSRRGGALAACQAVAEYLNCG